MKASLMLLTLIGTGFLNQSLLAGTCPDPDNSSLQWGEIPPPWVADPFSANTPQGDDNTRFIRANIMVAGLGRGVVCTYHNSLGDYSIWRQVLVKIPSRQNINWIDTLGGYVCTRSFSDCEFNAADESP